MELFYLLVILIGSTCAKVVVHEENILNANEIGKDDSHTKTTAAAPTEATLINTLKNNVEEHVNASNDDFGTSTTLATDTTKPTPSTLENSIEKDNVSNDDPVTSATLATDTESTKDSHENELDSDFLKIISGSAIHSSDETAPTTPANTVDNGTALHLTPFIKDGRIAEARNASSVDPDLFEGFESYSGFLTVDEELKSYIFFWYFPVAKKPVNDTPWIVWMQGGPGASSMTGLFDEIGPINVSPFGTVKKNRYSWLQNHSLLFIDNPVGTGYSYTESSNGYTKNLETYATHLHTAMKQFIQLFPELQSAPLFIAGESYAGKYVPALASKIHRHRDEPPHFNLQGIMLGNALVDPAVISNVVEPFQYFGLMDETQLSAIKPLVDGFRDDIAQNRSVQAKSKWVSLISSLLFLSHLRHAYNFLRDDLNVGKYSHYLDKSEVKRALHVGDIKFNYLNVTVNLQLAPDFLSNTRPLVEELLDHYRVLVYCGQLDQMLPCLYTSKNYRTWTWNGTEEFLEAIRYPYIFNGRNAGYHKTGGRLSEVVFRGAGHMVPLDAPAPAQALVTRFTHGEPLGPRNAFYEQTVRAMQSYLLNATHNDDGVSVINF